MKTVFSVLLLFVSILVPAQDFTGKIINKTTNEPIPFAYVFASDSTFGTISKFDGSFTIPKRFEGTVFIVTVLGYESFTLAIEHNTFLLPVSLSPKNFFLNEVRISPSKYNQKWLNDFVNPSGGIYDIRNGGEIATFIDKSGLYPQSQINKVSVFIHNISNNNFLRLHIYNYNLLCSCPGKELLDSNYLISGGIENDWFEFDIRSSRVNLPENGFFVSFEGFRANTNSKNDTLELGAYSKTLKFGHHTFRKDFMGKWKKPFTPKDFEVINVLNLAVKVEISYNKGNIRKILKSEKTQLNYNKYSKRKIKKIFGVRNVFSENTYPNYSFETLIESTYKALENDDIPYLVSYLFVIDKDQKQTVFAELMKRKEKGQWIDKEEKIIILSKWKEVLNDLDNAQFTKIDLDKFKVEFKNIKGASVFVQTDGKTWKILSMYNSTFLK